MATVTREDIRNYMVDHFELGHRAVHDGGSVTTPADDSEFGGPGGQERVENGAELLITSGTRDGDLCRVSKRPTLSGGVITCDPPPGGSLANDDTFTVLYRPWRFNDIHECINQALLEYVPEKLIVPFSIFEDADMLSTTTTNWTGTSSTLSKSSATFDIAALRTLQVLASASPGYAAQSVSVLENKTYYLEATATSLGGAFATTATLVLRDQTNSAEIALQDYTTDVQVPAFVVFQNTVTIPDNCLVAAVRLQSDTSGDGTLWTNIIFYPTDTLELPFADRIEPDRIGKVYYRIGDEHRDWQFVEIPGRVEQRTEGLYVLRLEEPPRYPVFYEDFTKRATLTSDSSTTSATAEEVGAVAAWLLLRQRQGTERWERQFIKARDRASAMLLKRRAHERTYRRVPNTFSLPAV